MTAAKQSTKGVMMMKVSDIVKVENYNLHPDSYIVVASCVEQCDASLADCKDDTIKKVAKRIDRIVADSSDVEQDLPYNISWIILEALYAS
jgi:hypothetical protein